MRLKIKYFASIRETVGVSEEVVHLDADSLTVDNLKQWLAQTRPALQDAFSDDRPVRVAVDHAVQHSAFPLFDGSEIAFFPPVTGG